MAKKFDDDDRPARPRPRKKSRNPNDPPPARLRPGEEEDDDEYDQRPQAHKGQFAEFDSRGRRVNQRRKRLLRNLSTAATLILVLGAFGYAIYLIRWAMEPPPPDPDMMAFVPARTSYLYGTHLEEARYNPKFRQKIDGAIDTAVPGYLRAVMGELKIRAVDLQRVIIACETVVPITALATPRGDPEHTACGVTAVLKLRRNAWQSPEQEDRNEEKVDLRLSSKDLQQLTTSEERTHKRFRYYAGKSFDGTPFYYHVASPSILVVSDSERQMKEVLDKPYSQILLTGPLKDLADIYGGENFWFAMAAMKGEGLDFQTLGTPITIGGRDIFGFNPRGPVAFGFGGGVHGRNTDSANGIAFASGPEAEELGKAGEEFTKLLADLNVRPNTDSSGELPLSMRHQLDVLSNTKFSVSGRVFSVSLRLKTSLVEELMDTGYKIGNTGFRLPYPFFQGPFAGLLPNHQYSNSLPLGGPASMLPAAKP